MKTETPRPFGDTRAAEEEQRAETFRMPFSLSERLAAAAQKYAVSKTYYLQLALKNQLEKDKIE